MRRSAADSWLHRAHSRRCALLIWRKSSISKISDDSAKLSTHWNGHIGTHNPQLWTRCDDSNLEWHHMSVDPVYLKVAKARCSTNLDSLYCSSCRWYHGRPLCSFHFALIRFTGDSYLCTIPRHCPIVATAYVGIIRLPTQQTLLCKKM